MFTLSLSIVLSLFSLNAAALTVPVSAPASPVNTVKIGADTYTYQSLVGKGIFPSDAVDQFGDTAGGWGSAIAADEESWTQNKDGSYQGTIYAAPDRGWNTNGIPTSRRISVGKVPSICNPGFTDSTSLLLHIMTIVLLLEINWFGTMSTVFFYMTTTASQQLGLYVV